MSLFGTMQTSVSGMNAQSNALSAIGDNIANSGTTGYKAASAQFATLLGQSTQGNYESGGVQTSVRTGITKQGTISATTSSTDLAINGAGFFVVSKNGQGQYLTRAGSFVADASGNLVNTAGYQLMGYPMVNGKPTSTLQVVNVSASTYLVGSSTKGAITGNLPATDPNVTGTLPSANQASSTYSYKTSITMYDNLGTPDVLDLYFSKTAANTWEVSVYQQSAATNGGFPYGTAGSAPLGTGTLTFNSTTGALTSSVSPIGGATTNGVVNFTIPNGNPITLDVSGMQSLATSFGVTPGNIDGAAPAKLASVSVGKDGVVTGIYGNGLSRTLYQVPLANVAAPNSLTAISGNVYQANNDSGPIVFSAATTNGLGEIDGGSLEASTVDLASELTNMIQAQRTYEANSKVLQTASDLLGVLNRISTS